MVFSLYLQTIFLHTTKSDDSDPHYDILKPYNIHSNDSKLVYNQISLLALKANVFGKISADAFKHVALKKIVCF